MPETASTAGAFSDNLLAELAEVVAMLVLVLMIFLVLAWLYKKMSAAPGRSNAAAQVLGSTSLGGKERVVVVQVADARLVLGVTTSSVNVLHVMQSEGIESDAMLEPSHDPGSSGNATKSSSFSSILSTVLGDKERARC